MTHLEYYITHVFPTGFQSIRGSFRIWCDLMIGKYKDYSLMWYDDPYEECINWFWQSLGEDEVLPKSFLEHLHKLAEDVRTGKEKTYSLDEVMKELKSDTIDPSVLEDWMGEPLTEEKLKELQEGGYVVDEEEDDGAAKSGRGI